ncbi:MAG: hypothetical protein K6G83_00220 [Lachnospiraceae bacterium]|nr:hypothetical protein [Lachnospiraceae bacterium]
MKKNRFILLLTGALLLVMLTGFAKRTVELLDQEPLIDLDTALQTAPPGSHADESAGESDKDPTDVTGQTQSEPEEVTPEKEPDPSRTFRVTVRQKEILCEKQNFDSVEALRGVLLKDVKAGDRVSLNDDYAEAHVYRRVLKLLTELKDTIGFSLTESMS